MPWDKDNLPAVAKNWMPEEQRKCIIAANAALKETDDEEQAIFACIHAAGKSKEMIAKFSETATIIAEVFAIGKWNGMNFTHADLDEIATNFQALKELHKVPLKFGHNDDQPVTDGQPALGWITEVWRKDGKLMARMEHVPAIVRKAFEARLYRRVSIELDIGVEHKGKKYRYVLSGVALLGADIPAVNTLADLDHYLDGGQRLAASRRAAFSSVTGNITDEEIKMSDDIKKQLDQLTAQFSALAATQAETAKVNAETMAENKELKSKLASIEGEAKSVKVKMHRESLVGMLESAVKAGKLLPAQREMAIKFMRLDNDVDVLAVTAEQIGDYIKINGKAMDFSQHGRDTGGDANNDDADADAGSQITKLARDLMEKNKGLTFSAARDRVLSENVDLGKRWLN